MSARGQVADPGRGTHRDPFRSSVPSFPINQRRRAKLIGQDQCFGIRLLLRNTTMTQQTNAGRRRACVARRGEVNERKWRNGVFGGSPEDYYYLSSCAVILLYARYHRPAIFQNFRRPDEGSGAIVSRGHPSGISFFIPLDARIHIEHAYRI